MKQKTPHLDILWIIDFDHTLLETNRMVRDYAKMLKRTLDIPESVTIAAKMKAQKKGGIFDYEHQLELLARATKVPLARIKKESTAFYGTTPKYFFPDAAPFLRMIARRGDHAVLLSYGHINHQRNKIKRSGIGKYFKRIIITDLNKGKAQWVKKYLGRSKRIVFVNDHPLETAAILKSGVRPWKVFLVERPKGKYYPIPPHKDYVVVRDLRKIEGLL